MLNLRYALIVATMVWAGLGATAGALEAVSSPESKPDLASLKIEPNSNIHTSAKAAAAPDEARAAVAADGQPAGQFSEVKPGSADVSDQFSDIENAPVQLVHTVPVGEQLTYQVRWKGIPAGTITMSAKRIKRVGERRALSLEMKVESNDFLSIIYPVKSTISSLVDVETGQSYLFRRKLREGRRRVDDRLQFDYENQVAGGAEHPVSRYSKVKKGQTVNKDPRPIPGPVIDSLSLVYYLRHLAFHKPGDRHELLMGSRKRVDRVYVTAQEWKSRRTALGTFDCIVVEPSGEDGVDRDNIVAAKGAASVWIEKTTGIPVYMSVAVPFGTATCTLIKAENSLLTDYIVK